MTAKKYLSINKTTKSTATRDLQELVNKNIFVRMGAGRSTAYGLNLVKTDKCKDISSSIY